MEARFSSRVVKTTEQGRLLLSDSFRPILSALWSGCHTISDIANRAGVDFNTAYYRVRQLESNGLVQVGSIAKRKGRGIKYYELTADSYKVPFSLTSHDTITDFVQKDFGEDHKVFASSISKHLTEKYSYDEAGIEIKASGGRLHKSLYVAGDQTGDTDAISIWIRVLLREDELQKIIDFTYEMLKKSENTEGERHLFGLHLVKLPTKHSD